jgi:hypothetical protein
MIIFLLFLAFVVCVQSAIITAPNNIICFPERDYCSLENFLDLTGQSLLVEVNRNGAIVGSTTGIVSGNIVAFDINHPGGRCWGDGTTIKITPDIQPGDLVTVKNGALLLGDMTISNGYITTYSLSGTTLIITGYIASNVIPNNIEVRIVNPLLNKKIIALTGPLTPFIGYSSGLDIIGTIFTATFVFDAQDVANIAGSGVGYSLLMWQVTTANGARQGLTISEFGLAGGPFSNICPPGPLNVISPIAHAIGISGNTIKWAPGQDIIGSPPTTGFSVSILRGDQVYGYRLPKTENQVTFGLTTLNVGDNIELRSMVGTKMSDAFVVSYQPQTLTPTITSIPANNVITEVQTELIILNSNTGQIVYTLDNSPVLDINNKISPNALLYYAPIPITTSTVLRAVSFDRSGSFSNELIGKFGPPLALLPQSVVNAPSIVVQNGGVVLSWIKPNDPTIISFGIDVFTSAGIKIGITRIVTSTTLIITDLVPDTSYQFTVTSRNMAGSSAPSPKSISVIFPSPTDTITITTAKYIANKQFKITGTGSIAATAMLYSTNLNGSIGSPIYIRGTTTVISAPIVCTAGTCTFTMDIRNANVPLTNPGRIYVKSTLGGIAGPLIIA